MSSSSFAGARVVAPASLHQALRRINGVRLWAGAPLAPFTTFGTGGRGALLLSASTPDALQGVLALLESAECPWQCLGAGSNLLVSDQGYPGVLVKLDERFQYVEGLPEGGRGAQDGEVSVTVGAGVFLTRLSALVAEAGLSGLEFCCGIPGSVGGAVAMNAGAHGGSMADVVEAVHIVSAKDSAWIDKASLEWGYRFCRIPGDSMVVAVKLRLSARDAGAVLEFQRSLLRMRRLSQPRGVRTFGSVFKNPSEKDSAGLLLEAAGAKGLRRGGAEVSRIHANFIVNSGSATTSDVLVLMGLMRQGVHRVTGILLEPEVRLLGCSFPWDETPTDSDTSAPPASQPNG